jgi:hypothetical protein
MKHHNKFSPKQQQENASELQAAQNTAREFSTAEELLRHDASRTAVPPGIAQRLQKSSADIPKPGRSFWQRLFGQ